MEWAAWVVWAEWAEWTCNSRPKRANANKESPDSLRSRKQALLGLVAGQPSLVEGSRSEPGLSSFTIGFCAAITYAGITAGWYSLRSL